MPHLIIEYSANLLSDINLDDMLAGLHETVLTTGVFPLGGIRLRAYPSQNYQIADGHKDNTFIHVHMRIGYGRDEETLINVSKSIFEFLSDYLEPIFQKRPIGLSVELNEIVPETSFKKNNLHDYVSQRKSEAS